MTSYSPIGSSEKVMKNTFRDKVRIGYTLKKVSASLGENDDKIILTWNFGKSIISHKKEQEVKSIVNSGGMICLPGYAFF